MDTQIYNRLTIAGPRKTVEAILRRMEYGSGHLLPERVAGSTRFRHTWCSRYREHRALSPSERSQPPDGSHPGNAGDLSVDLTCTTLGEDANNYLWRLMAYEGADANLIAEVYSTQSTEIGMLHSKLSRVLTIVSEDITDDIIQRMLGTDFLNRPEQQQQTTDPVGSKYHRTIRDCREGARDSCVVDVYAVLKAYRVTCPAQQHALKKLLCPGQRAKGSAVQDLREAREAITRAIELCLADETEETNNKDN